MLLPHYLLNQELAFDRLSGLGVAAIIMGWGAPMVLLVNVGLLFAPAKQEAAALVDSADVIGVYVQDPSSFLMNRGVGALSSDTAGGQPRLARCSWRTLARCEASSLVIVSRPV